MRTSLDMYNNDVCKGVVYAYETYEAKKRVAAFRSPVCFMNFGLIPDRHRYCTYLYYSRVGYPGRGSSNLSTAQSPHPRALGARGPRSRSSAEMTRSHLLSDSSSGRPGAQPAVRHKQNLPLALGRSRSDTCTRRLRSPLGKRGTGRILPAEGEMIVKPTFLGSMQFSLGRPFGAAPGQPPEFSERSLAHKEDLVLPAAGAHLGNAGPVMMM